MISKIQMHPLNKGSFLSRQILGFEFVLFGAILQKFERNNFENRKRKKKLNKKKKKAAGRPFVPAREMAHGLPVTPNRIDTFLNFISLTSWAHSSDPSSSLGQTPPPARRSPWPSIASPHPRNPNLLSTKLRI
jgi:hypothetical protein